MSVCIVGIALDIDCQYLVYEENQVEPKIQCYKEISLAAGWSKEEDLFDRRELKAVPVGIIEVRELFLPSADIISRSECRI